MTISETYRQTYNTSRTLIGNKIADYSNVVGVPSVGVVPTTSTFSTEHLAPMDWAQISARWDEKGVSLGVRYGLYWKFDSKLNWIPRHNLIRLIYFMLQKGYTMHDFKSLVTD